jgi:hypothetical protein
MTLFEYLLGVLWARGSKDWVKEAAGFSTVLSAWLPFLGIGDNAHAKYNSRYTALPGNTKTAVQLAFEHLTTVAASTTSRIHILTFDGTASLGGTATTANPSAKGNLTGQDVFKETGGAYPAILGYRLSKTITGPASTPVNSAKWVWHGIDYHPEYALTGEPATIGSQVAVPSIPPAALGATIPTIGKNVARAVVMAQQVIASIPAGEKIVLSGLSQGSFAVRVLYDEFRIGALQSRRNDLIGIVNFGDACRPAGVTIPGGTNPGGEGVCKLPVWLPLSQQWTTTGLIQNPDSFYRAYTNPTDAATTSPAWSSSGGRITGLVCKAVLYGPPTASGNWGLLEDWTTRSDYFRFLGTVFSRPLASLRTAPGRARNRSTVDGAALRTAMTAVNADVRPRWVYGSSVPPK